jgi:hypothetical protein
MIRQLQSRHVGHGAARGWVAPLVALAVVMLACGFGGGTSTIAQGGGSTPAAPTATHTPAAPTATPPPPPPTATPTPGHLLVTIIPNSSTCSGSSCNPYICHNGTTCDIDWTCLSPAWPTLNLSNSGQAALTWQTAITQYNPDGPPWSLSQTSGTLAGGAATNVTITNGPGGGMKVVFTGPAQTVTLSITCGIG